MQRLRSVLDRGDEHGLVALVDAAIAGGDRAIVRASLASVRLLPRDVAVPLFGRVRSAWPELVSANHPMATDAGATKLGPSDPLQALLQRALYGDRDGALRIVDDQPAKWDGKAGSADDLRALIRSVPAASALPRPPVVDHGEDVLASRPGPRGRVVVFCGLSDRAMFDLPVLDAYIAAAGYGALFLRDSRRRLFATGVAGVAGGRAGFGQQLREWLAAESGEVVFAASSAGGLGMLDWACELGVRRALAFAMPTTTRREGLERTGDDRCVLLQRTLARDGIELDARERLEATGHTGAVQLFYGAGMGVDRRHAEHLAGLPGVRLHPVADCADHRVLLPLASSGRLVPILRGG
jgi:hypothetical protein